MPSDLAALRLDLAGLADVALALEARIREGLAIDHGEIRAIPAFLRPPPVGLSGEALVVDAGGTNVRAARVRIGGAGDAVIAGPHGAELPVRGQSRLEAAEFWRLQADLAAQCRPEAGLPLGYCFSYPSEVGPDGDARLITWTKGVAIDGVEGHSVGAPLAAALAARGIGPRRTVVLNDTVAALLGGSVMAPEPERTIGLIVGTGTNMAAYFRPGVAPKLAAYGPEPMAINLESGNFHPPHLSAADAAFDAASPNPGRQRFEKAVSGYALPHVFAHLVPSAAGFDPAEGTAPIVELRRSGSGEAQEAAALLLDRSADLVAAALVGVARVLGGTAPLTVFAEGSLFWKADGYAARVAETLERLAPRGPRFGIGHRPDVNLFGSATAALATT